MKTARWLLPAALTALFIAGCGHAPAPAPSMLPATGGTGVTQSTASPAATATPPPAPTPTFTLDVGIAAPPGSQVACQMVGPALLAALMGVPVEAYEGVDHTGPASGCFVYGDHRHKTVLTGVDCGSSNYQVSLDFDQRDAAPIASLPGGYIRTQEPSYAFVVVNRCLIEISYLDGTTDDRPALEAALKAAYDYVKAGHRP